MQNEPPAAQERPKNLTDPSRKRATFGVPYPMQDLLLKTKEDLANLEKANPDDVKGTVRARRITLTAERRNVPPTVFEECNFHDKKGTGVSSIRHLSFRDSTFSRSMMGTARYENVSFRDCVFYRCDFTHAQFLDCLFDRCEFKECTGEGATFSKTEIDPIPFLSSISCPLYNFQASSDKDKAQVTSEWPEIRVRLAAQLLRSNSEILNTDYADRGLLELKRAELALAKERFRASSKRGWFEWFALRLRELRTWWTDGGTSLRKIALSLIIAMGLAPIGIRLLGIRYQGRLSPAATSAAELLEAYVQMIPAAVSLVLTFGFTNFSSGHWAGDVFVVCFASFGLGMFGLLISVLVRKVYR